MAKEQTQSVVLGTMAIPSDQTVSVIHRAIELGYRSFDTSPVYGNEEAVGNAIRTASVDRSDLRVATKLWNSCHGYAEALAAFERTAYRLGMDFVDLYLIHWPVPTLNRYVESWQALVRLRDEGRVGAIGVSNFLPEHLERIIDATGVVPAVNQIEMHPSFRQAELREFHDRLGIITQAWSPLGNGQNLNESVITEIAATHQRSPAQVVLRWLVQQGVCPVAKSSSARHLQDNLAVHDFRLTDDEMARIDSLDRSTSCFGVDPRTFVAPPELEGFCP